MSDEQHSWTLNDSARASNPGNLKLNPVRWVRSYPLLPSVMLAGVVIGLILIPFSKVGIPMAIFFLIWSIYHWRRVYEHFRHGCANPAVILSVDPMLIAVSTDLTTGEGQYPAVKVIRKKLETVNGKPPKVGMKVGTIALYSQGFSSKRWGDFDPRPVDCATNDLEAITRVMNSFEDEDWQELKRYLAQVPRPYKPGLYHIELDQL